jgi:hypothetical protein
MSASSFDDREHAMEKKHAQEEEARFRETAQAVRLFGLWAAGQQGLKPDAAKKYANSLSDLHVSKKGAQHITAKVKTDLAAKNITLSDRQLENQFNVHLDEVKKASRK